MPRPARYFQPQLAQQINTAATLLAAYFRCTLNYRGPIFRVRRASDNAEQDFFSPSPAQVAAFCGASNGFVTIVYDQSGNGFNWSEAVVAAQPKIYDSATGIVKLVSTGTTIAALFDGTDDQFIRNGTSGFAGNPAWTISTLHQSTDNTVTTTAWLFGLHSAGADGYISWLASSPVSATNLRMLGAGGIGVTCSATFTGTVLGAQWVVTSHPAGGTDAATVMSRNGVVLTQTASNGNTINIDNTTVNNESKWGASRSLAGPSALFWKGTQANFIAWNNAQLAGSNLANLNSWQNARLVS